MIKQLAIPALGVILLCTSCDRQTTSAFILSVGLNAESNSPFASLGRGSAVETAPSRTRTDTSIAAGVLSELRGLQRDPGARQPSRLAKLVERMRDLEASARQAERAAELAIFEEATLAALSIGAELQPELYGEEHRTYSDRLSNRGAGSSLERASLQRVLGVLADEVSVGRRRDVVALHSATYPSCDMNIDLLVTITRQLTDQSQFIEAIELAREGLQVCSGHPAIRRLSDELRRIYVDNPGQPGVPMNFSGPDLAGDRFELKSLRGEPVLVTFWASWCPSCQRESAVIDRIAERYENIKVVGVSMDKNRRQLEAFLKRNGLRWRQIYADKPGQKGWDNPIAKYYRIESIPSSFLVDRQGDVAAAGLRGEHEITAAIAELLMPADAESYAAR